MTENANKTDLLIIIPPSGMKNNVYPPYGAMYIASALRSKGYRPSILNTDTETLTYSEAVERVAQIDPVYIGFSGIVASKYKYIKDMSLRLREAFPAKMQILGGGLSSAAEVVLKNTSIDIVVCGEGDITAVELMDCLRHKGDLSTVRGIYYRNNSSYISTGRRELIGKLDSLAYPAFDLIDINKYMPDGVEFIRNFTTVEDKRILDPKRKRRMLTIPTNRGCFAECSFCFRAYPGLRVHSIGYVFDLVEYCIKKFDAGFFSFGDECFAPNKARNWEFINEFKKRNLDIIFRILGMRVDTVDKEILKAYREIGCWMIEYGFESGSQKMLNIIDKRVSVERNREVALWTKEGGIFTTPALVIGMPGETEKTISETIDFLKSMDLDFKQYLWKYAIPIPGSHLYNFAKINGIIKDEDCYLSSLMGPLGDGGIFHLNLTDEPDGVVSGWGERINSELDSYYFYKRYKIKNRLLMNLFKFLATLNLIRRRKKLLEVLTLKLKSLSVILLPLKRKRDIKDKPSAVSVHKKVNIERFLKEADYTLLNRDASLKKINQKLVESTAGN